MFLLVLPKGLNVARHAPWAGRPWRVSRNPSIPDCVPVCLPRAVAPSPPGRVLVSRDTKTSVVVEWDRPKHHEDLLGYYVDCCVAGSNVWEPCNHKPIGYNRCGPPRRPEAPAAAWGKVQDAKPS